MQLLEPGHLEKDYQIQGFLETKDFFFGKRTNNINKFKGYFLSGQVMSSNSCNVSNGCIVEP